jgi:hypothetical protein
MQYCPTCGKYHEITTAGCPPRPPYEYNTPPVSAPTIEDLLKQIIDYLQKIEYHLRTAK